MPAELKTRLEEAAMASGRSLTAEMVQRLERSFEEDDLTPTLTAKELRDLLDSIDKQLMRLIKAQVAVDREARASARKKPRR